MVIGVSLSTNGLIVRVNNVGEYDRFISVLTDNYGVLSAYVHGARSLKNKNGAATSLLTYSHLSLDRKKDTYVVKEASSEKVFFNLRSDIEKLTLAQHFCELAYVLAPREEKAQEYLRLVLNSLSFLTDDKKDKKLLKAVTELKILSLSGYTPDLIACRECAKYEDTKMYFDAQNGEIYCEECKHSGLSLIPINNSVLAAMRHITFSEFRDIYSFILSDESLEELTSVVERFLLSQVEHRFSALQFYKNL